MGFLDFLFKSKSARSCPHVSEYVILDLETTGLSPSVDKIIQLSAIKYDATGQKIDSYDTYLNPGIPIPAEASRVNGITNRMVADAPRAADVREAFFDFLGDCLLVGYNTTFDLRFIEKAFDGRFTGCLYVDAMAIAKKAFTLPNYRLQTVAASVGFKSSRFHNSLVDCEAVAAILRRVAPDLQNWAQEFGGKSDPASDSGYWQGAEDYRLGEEQRLAGNFEAAMQLLEKARREGYRIAAVYISMAKIHRKLKGYDSEIAVLEKGLSECDPPAGKEVLLERKSRAQELLSRSQKREDEEQQKAQKREERMLRKQQEELRKAQEPMKDSSRPIVQLSDDGAVIKEFPSVAAASRELNISAKCIRDTAKGRQKHAGGYCWRYASTEPT